MRLLIAAVFSMMLVGCATSYVAPGTGRQIASSRMLWDTKVTHPQPAKLVFTRDSGFVGSAVELVPIINGKLVVYMSEGEEATITVDPGEYTVSVMWPLVYAPSGKLDKRVIEPGKTYYYRVKLIPRTFARSTAKIIPYDPATPSWRDGE